MDYILICDVYWKQIYWINHIIEYWKIFSSLWWLKSCFVTNNAIMYDLHKSIFFSCSLWGNIKILGPKKKLKKKSCHKFKLAWRKWKNLFIYIMIRSCGFWLGFLQHDSRSMISWVNNWYGWFFIIHFQETRYILIE